MKKNLWWSLGGLCSVTLLILLDQWTKIWMFSHHELHDLMDVLPGVFGFYNLKNYGSAFGMLQGARLFFIPFTILVMGFCVWAFIKTPKTTHYIPVLCSMILLVAGAIGNLIDRILFGFVRDFIYFYMIDFPVFNVADMYVVISVFLFIILLFTVNKDEKDFDYLKSKKENQTEVR
ncbi:MAG: signal peptidase II [Lachnospiraceae bacterium]|nr:signal peptidase II [Lachnospiraceae bacterium]